MTVVIAKKFGEYILIASDTEITDRGAVKRNVIPGGLKSIVIDLNCTIALAGNYIHGLDLIRSLRKIFFRTRDFDQLLELLRRDSESGECDYIVSMHRPQAEIRKIWKGRISGSVNAAHIGDAQVADGLLCLAPTVIPDDPKLQATQDQLAFYGFQGALQNINLKQGTSLGDVVGGILMLQMGSPFGHTYGGYAGATSWQITTDPALNAENDRARASGEKSFAFSIYSPAERGIPLVSVYFDQAQAGAIYSPLIDDFSNLVASDREEFITRVQANAKELGGVLTNDWTVPGQDFDAIARMVAGRTVIAVPD